MKRVRLTIPENDQRFDEAIKTLRTNILFSGVDIRKIMLTSTESNEGKSEIAFHTALAFARTGKKVLLIDADIHKSVVASVAALGVAVEHEITHVGPDLHFMIENRAVHRFGAAVNI
mgnify:CR=1 FL=1